MRSASRQAGRWRPVVVALGVAVATWSVSPPAIASEPTDVRVVSVTRGDDTTGPQYATHLGQCAHWLAQVLQELVRVHHVE